MYDFKVRKHPDIRTADRSNDFKLKKFPDVRIELKETRIYGSTSQNPDTRIELKEPGYTNEPGYTVRTERINLKKIPFCREPGYHFL